MQSANDLAAHLASLPPDLLKLFRLKQALRWHRAPKHSWHVRESTAYRMPPEGLSLYLGRMIHPDSSFDRAVNVLRHPAIAALPLRCLYLTIDPAAATRRSVDTFATLGHLAGLRQLEWSYDGALARGGAADEHLALTVLSGPHLDTLESLWLHGPRTAAGELLARPGAFARAVLRPGLAPTHLRLGETAVDDDFAAALAPIAARLRSLSTDHPKRGSIAAPTTPPQWERLLAAFPADNELRFLELSPGGQSVPPEVVVHALDRRAFPHLVSLVVRYAALDDRLVERLPESHLRRGLLLDLDGNRLSAPAVAHLQAVATRTGATLRADFQA